MSPATPLGFLILGFVLGYALGWLHAKLFSG
jgi:hypothetical protein